MTQDRTVKDHFHKMGEDGSYASFYGEEDSPLTHDFLNRRARICEFLAGHLRAGQKVLDIGCGTGPMVDFFASHGLAYHGLDAAQGMLDSIKKSVQEKPYKDSIHLKKGTSSNIPHDDATFDYVVAMGLLEYIDDMQSTFGEIARVLNTGGIAVLTIPNRRSLNRLMMRNTSFLTNTYQAVRRMFGRPIPPSQNIVHHELAPAALDDSLHAVGFECIGRAFYDYKLVCYPFTRIFPNLAFKINRRVENRGPSFLANGYIGFYKRTG